MLKVQFLLIFFFGLVLFKVCEGEAHGLTFCFIELLLWQATFWLYVSELNIKLVFSLDISLNVIVLHIYVRWQLGTQVANKLIREIFFFSAGEDSNADSCSCCFAHRCPVHSWFCLVLSTSFIFEEKGVVMEMACMRCVGRGCTRWCTRALAKSHGFGDWEYKKV